MELAPLLEGAAASAPSAQRWRRKVERGPGPGLATSSRWAWSGTAVACVLSRGVGRGVGRGHRGGLGRGQRQTRQAASVTEAATEVAPAKVKALKSLISDVLEARAPQQLETFLQVLQASGYTVLGKDDWNEIGGDLHPFLLPVATKGDFDDDLDVTALLIRSPTGQQLRPDEWQVRRVRCRRVTLEAGQNELRVP
ncbi:unnamed protein product [Effrenium voratum]|nr:unnamed protein product [Effrenium voratum]